MVGFLAASVSSVLTGHLQLVRPGHLQLAQSMFSSFALSGLDDLWLRFENEEGWCESIASLRFGWWKAWWLARCGRLQESCIKFFPTYSILLFEIWPWYIHELFDRHIVFIGLSSSYTNLWISSMCGFMIASEKSEKTLFTGHCGHGAIDDEGFKIVFDLGVMGTCLWWAGALGGKVAWSLGGMDSYGRVGIWWDGGGGVVRGGDGWPWGEMIGMGDISERGDRLLGEYALSDPSEG